ncbi:MAG: hypothetical protein L6R35_000879 [Caloplaca aegaea]|nr:MAG: hypothetical protein L6R35_000879 [Caloplaca aegaea]
MLCIPSQPDFCTEQPFVIPTAAGSIPPTPGGEVIGAYTDLRVSSSVNGTGPFLGSKHAVAQFLKQEPDTYGFRGTIINISSIGGQVGLMRCSAYCASKASIIGLSREVAIEYGRNGIRCNVICPGYIHTPMLQPWVAASPEFAAYLDAGIALGHIGNPADVAGAAAWLASGRESGYVTGAVIPVDGGFTAR